MNENNLKIGAVFKPNWDDRAIRVLLFDDETVIYDCWLPHKNDWSLASTKGVVNYFRLDKSRLLSDAAYVEMAPLSDAELHTHRPDLPLRMLQSNALQWASLNLSDIDSANATLLAVNALLAEEILAVPAIFLIPFSKTGKILPGVKICAKNEKSFTAAELILAASNLEYPLSNGASVVDGVGLYRAGTQKGLPSFYIWGAMPR